MLSLLFKLISVYLLISIILGLIPVNVKVDEDIKTIEIFLSSNGVHTDIILPIETTKLNWPGILKHTKFEKLWKYGSHIAFGWGDRGFYLKTPEWKDLKPGTAMKAMLMNSPAAMHVTLLRQPTEGRYMKKVFLSPKQFAALEMYIYRSFTMTNDQQAIFIDHPGYGTSDLFFEANYSFNLVNTCNVWTNRALKVSGIRTSVWTPFDKAIFFHLSKIQ